MVAWITDFDEINKDDAILDIGCGNGYTLVALANEDYTNLHGSDYSETAINLAKLIAEKEEIEINYIVDDILNTKITTKFNVVLDKGTLDAMALSDNKENVNKYISTVPSYLVNGGYFMITSCNFTHDELKSLFSTVFKYHTYVKYPTFQFGGVEGSTVSTVIFKKI